VSQQTSRAAAFASLPTLVLAAAVTAGCEESITPPAPPVLAAFIAAGHYQTCALTDAGAAYCWGDNPRGQLGNGTTAGSAVPVAVSGNVTFSAIAIGFQGACGIASTGPAYCWGILDPSTVPPTDSLVPVAVSGGLTLRALAMGGYHTCGLTSTGAAHCWGANAAGQLGDGSLTDSPVPVAVSGDSTFSVITAGSEHSCAISSAGAAYCWGSNLEYQLGDSSDRYTYRSATPIPVSGGMTFKAIAAGTMSYHTCALTTAGMAYCWGDNLLGQLGNDTNRSRSATPVAVSGGLHFGVLAIGLYHTCGLTGAGAAYCWGGNSDGQLGDGSLTDRSIPVAVAGGLIFSAIAAGDFHTCALTSAGAVYCWGANLQGQLGDGSLTDSPVPVRARVFGPRTG
jgi:alpha-tubulin suppressor-like RCC1 family protein